MAGKPVTRTEVLQMLGGSLPTGGGGTYLSTGAAASTYVAITEAPLNVARYGVVGDGVTDDAAAMNAALTAAGASGGRAEVYIPPMPSFIKVLSTVTIPTQVRMFSGDLVTSKIHGAGAADTLTFAPGDRQDLDRIYATAGGGGHVLRVTDSSQFSVKNCLFEQAVTTKSCVYHLDTGAFIDATFEKCQMYAATGASVAAIHLENSNNNLALTRWRDMWFQGNATMTAPFMRVINSHPGGSGIMSSNHTMDNINAEVCVAGILEAASVNGFTVNHVAPWDVTTYTQDIFKFYTFAGGDPCRNIEVKHSGRRGGALTGGKFDVNFSATATECVAMFMQPMHSPTTAATILMPTVKGLKIGSSGSTGPMVESFDPWTTFTVSTPNLPLTSSTGKYIQQGKTVHVRVIATVSGAATGVIALDLPVTAASTGTGRFLQSTVVAVDTSGSTYVAGMASLQSTTQARFQPVATAAGQWNATLPFTWASTDTIDIAFTYEAA